jgi:hypothetical protein
LETGALRSGDRWYFDCDWVARKGDLNEQEAKRFHPHRAADRRGDHRHSGGHRHSEPSDRNAALASETHDGGHAHHRFRMGSTRDGRQPVHRRGRELASDDRVGSDAQRRPRADVHQERSGVRRWSNEIVVGTNTSGSSYAIRSYGADKVVDATTTTATAAITTQNFDCDIIYSEGSFVQYPEGVQSQ